MPLMAGGVTLPNDLAGALNQIKQNGYSNIGSNYGGLLNRQNQEGSIRGLPGGSNSYGTDRLAKQQALDQGGLESALAGQWGQAGYQNAISQRDYAQKAAIANSIAASLRPSLLQNVFSGVGQVGGTAAQLYGAFGNKRKNPYNFYAGNDIGYGGGSQPTTDESPF